MLKCVLEEENKSWDEMLPFVLFTYREVPQESTDCWPFKLICLRDLRDRLDILKENWIALDTTEDDIALYVMKTRGRMEKATQAVQESLKESQQKR